MEKRNLEKLFLILFFCIGNIFWSFSNIVEVDQVGASVTGQVTDSKGESLIGVNVIEVGTSNGTVTDFDGNYSLVLTTQNAVLSFTYVGFLPKEVTVGNERVINVTLAENIETLDELVVVGYGTQSKRFVTGAISSVNIAEENKNLPNTNISQLIGNIPGVQFIGDGRPGQGGTLLIRGQNSLSANNDPLIVLDGVIFSGSLSDINPQDIEKVDILKDASSATVYGSRAANGVILITSKKGLNAKPTVRLNTFYGVSNPSYEVKMLTPERYIERRLDWRRQLGMEADPSKVADYLTASEAENYKKGITQNNWDIVYQDASIYSVDFNISARTDLMNYFLSVSKSDEKGLIFNDNLKRNTVRANINGKVNEWLSLGTDATFSYRDMSGISASVQNAYRSSPFATFFHPDGEPTEYSVVEEQAGGNPVRNAILTKNEEKYETLFSNFYVNVDVPFIEGLSYKLNYSPNLMNGLNYNYTRQDKHIDHNNTSANKYNSKRIDLTMENIVTYNKVINDNNAFDLTFLYSNNKTTFESTRADANKLVLDGLGYNNLSLGSVLTNSSDAYEIEGESLMGRINYRLKNRYLYTFTVRRDGSSVFAKNKKYATFPSASAAWILSDEPFIKSIDFIDMLKLRASYGAVGNQAIRPYQSLSLSDITRYVYSDGGSTSIGVNTSSLGNEDLKWESTYSSNVALDFEVLSRRLTGTIEFYDSNTKDLLVRRAIPVMNGFKSVLSNIGDVNNRGIELTLNSQNINKNKFGWSSSFSLAYNKNKIKHLYGTDLDGDGKEDSDIGNNWFIGYPISSFYDYEFDGIYQVGDDIPVGSEPGFVKVKDLNKDGKITPDDRKVVGSGNQPNYILGLKNDFRYGQFTFSLYVNSMLDWIAPFNLINPLVPGRALSQIDTDWWTPENKSNKRPSLNYSNPLGTNWYLSRNFVRIKDLSLSYEFDKKLIEKINVSGLRIYGSVKNLYTFTNWLGADPENTGNYFSEQGADIYPMPRTFAVGINLEF